MRDGSTWVFVEVRYRRNSVFGSAAASVTRQKQRHLLHAAALWLLHQGQSFDTADCRFDVLAVTGTQVEWLPNAFGQPD
ncbi:Predicted endonuclease distantly related to archaeal Holliday junction resolvase [Dickeya aquatica]|uniref:Predicted endonuclease distantly related to archaeal Holliday junction resolvase n=2 Tax=Pectobacteriaceae TaxID=1903410 RepID=A0A375A6H0_9GAMM|nr:Predicted endonuclease distantly related to archaeal Holliday junction resolvase [Dickeya aquatica]